IDHAHSVDATSAVYLSAAYGVTDDLTIAARIPYVFRDDLRSSHIHDGAVEISQDGDSAGHGDLLVLAMYRVIALGEEGVDASVIAGIEMPTGFTTDRSRSGRVFHVEHQPGSGSWDPLVGIALSRPMGPVSIHASAVYTIATEGARETDLGDMLRYGLAVVWRVGGASHHHHDEDENGVEPHRHDGLVWDLILELEGQWQDKAEIAGRDDENSGGYELFLSPGVRLNVNERWSVYGAVGVPVYQDKNGAGHETDFRVIAGVAVSL
ncbi:MAG TPA: hypothetical protein VK116_13725, partial [Planctomycetota bacterium]|nr:hypothetical protein [Planctomycetota bacterium]